MIPVYWHTFTHADRDYWPMIADTGKMDSKIEKLRDKYKHVKSKGDVWQSVARFISQLLFIYFVIKIPRQRKPQNYLINVLRVKSHGILFENPSPPPNILLNVRPICRCHMSQYVC